MRQGDNILVKEADKDGAVVILNKEDYIHEVLSQLETQEFYEPLKSDPLHHIMNIIKHMVQEGLSLGYINNNNAKFLINNFPRIPGFYHLSKI